MTQEEKQLLLKDLCSRLPYGVKLDNGLKLRSVDVLIQIVSCTGSDRKIDYVKPYLRPMSSMTKEEKKQCSKTQNKIPIQWDDCGKSTVYTYANTIKTYDWLNENHFDYRGLISMGLALEAPEGMYKNE